MKTVIHKNTDRGKGDHGWLSTRFSFSFANWYEPTRMGFGNLRVLNDDTIMPDSGFGMHPHSNMEIVSIVTEGEVTHVDSMNNDAKVTAGEIQVMTAGTGITHSEYNKSTEEVLKLFQIWILPKKEGLTPSYSQKDFRQAQKPNELTLLVSPTGEDDSLTINQDAYIHRGVFDQETTLPYAIKHADNGVYLFIVKGSVLIGDETLQKGDAIGISETTTFDISVQPDTEVLLFEV
jgi:redox-sensitive bicupin YhaK (pirin superfamily)